MTFKQSLNFLSHGGRKKNLILSALLAFLIICYSVSYLIIATKQTEKGTVFPIDGDTVVSITLTSGSRQTIIKKQGNNFVFITPYGGTVASSKKVRAYVGELKKLSVIRDLGFYDAQHTAPFGISSASANIIVDDGKKKIQLVCGRNSPVAAESYVYFQHTHRLVLTQSGAQALLTIKPEDFRENQLFAVAPSEVRSVEIVSRLAQHLLFHKEGDVWSVKDCISHHVYPCDTKPVAALISEISKTPIIDFVPADEHFALDRCGLTVPRIHVCVTLSSGTVCQADIGSPYDHNRIFVARSGVVAGGISAGFIHDISPPTSSYFRTNIVDFPPARITSIICKTHDENVTFEKHRGDWFRTAGKKRSFDLEKMDTFLQYLSALTAVSFLPDQPLGDVSCEYVFFSRTGKQLLDLEIGGRSGNVTKVRINKDGVVIGVSPQIVEMMTL
ncbi:MAG: DUF4340 domain-containing protein [Endomicrobiales bacterium]